MGIGALIKRGLGRVMPGAVLVKGRPAPRPRLAITFDDGPHPEHTPRILDALDAAGAKATFFVQGAEVAKYPELAREAVRRGHQLGNHGYSHLDAKRTPRDLYVADTRRAQQVLQEALGGPAERIFRPPHGSVTPATFVALAGSGFRYVFWSADARDSFIRTAGELVGHVETLPLADGDILLLHEDYAHTVEALPRILERVRGRSLDFATIRELA